MLPMLLSLGWTALAGPPPDLLHAHMAEHLTAATAARDAIIGGDLDTARDRLTWIATHEGLQKLPADAAPHLEAMREAARKGSAAEAAHDVSTAVGRVAQACGSCHSGLKRGPLFGEIDPPPAPEGFAGRMRNHAWSADRMWEGLIAPAPHRWDAGAVNLLADPHYTPGGNPAKPPPSGVLAFIERIQAAGMEALTKSDDAGRAQLYGELLSTCAACHEDTGKPDKPAAP